MPKMPSMHSGRAKPSPSKIRRTEPGGSAGILTVVLVVISLIMFTFSVREGEGGVFSGARAVVQTIVSPLRMLGGYAGAPFSGMSNIMRNLTADEQTLSELKEENARLVARNVELEEAQQTAQRLEQLMELRNTYNLQSIAARIISSSSDSWVDSVSIDKGALAGLSVGMPVSNQMGAVGQVIQCAANTATVRLLTDEASSVSAMVQASRAQGMLVGSPDGTLKLTLIRTDQTVNVGDVVVTSGLGGVFPKGLPVGKVASIEKSPGATYYDIVVEPYFRPETLEEVLVITSLTEGQEATSEDIEAADAPDLDAASGHAVSPNNASSDAPDGEAEANANGDGEQASAKDQNSSASSTEANNAGTNGSSNRSSNQQQKENALSNTVNDEESLEGV